MAHIPCIASSSSNWISPIRSIDFHCILAWNWNCLLREQDVYIVLWGKLLRYFPKYLLRCVQHIIGMGCVYYQKNLISNCSKNFARPRDLKSEVRISPIFAFLAIQYKYIYIDYVGGVWIYLLGIWNEWQIHTYFVNKIYLRCYLLEINSAVSFVYT